MATRNTKSWLEGRLRRGNIRQQRFGETHYGLAVCQRWALHGFPSWGKDRAIERRRIGEAGDESVKTAADGKDGISYLMANLAAGIKTPLTPAYEAEILRQTNTQSLEEALGP